MSNQVILGIKDKIENMEKETILTEIISTQSLPDYEAADVLWTTLTKVVNITKQDGKSIPEHDFQELESLIEEFSEDEKSRLFFENADSTYQL